ncbi:hypothetical protein HZS38_17965 [Xenorhabdus nematophila]|uniref:Uncharacterized protein n=1 Tax=Xenorhabdus nematophila (strain ATCC 19061 / DSM 3370 / CCUG 14189 / LMG 1036 / NCIMB 9965 / AN6) TaxID=406817 RepID=D3VBY6_XENNA|nr:hypothetical protein [Xenorhabdus nematophila]CEE90694.1 conserved hypothetical protein [Xenorhabdus nematophila str. Anatoliense]CEF32617.1 conserved hypothetical protein [Xenorhabdus nematophila str. Websteri]AYA42200.1 hypothetical protein D3790_18680 [Xenorhabdus nematophila]KHD28954.1 hypothetical protein LH67_06735 [Xenorhabdus nematophila]MBA0020926.1 hypothetical protein [Xenorhabdus nematophila]
MSNVILYGDVLHIKNEYGNGSYLDTYGHANSLGEKYNVVTSVSPNRDTGSGSWQILSAEGKSLGTAVCSSDIVFLLNSYLNNGGYLRVSGNAPSPELYNVYTADRPIYSLDTAIWHLFSDTTHEFDGKVREGNIIRLLNNFNQIQGGFLDTCWTSEHPGTIYKVYTSLLSNRDSGSGIWTLSKSSNKK